MNSNKETVRRYFGEVLDNKDFAVMAQLFHDDVVMHRPGIDLTGLSQILEVFPLGLAVYSSFKSTLTDMIADGDFVSVRVYHETRVVPHVMHTRLGPVDITTEQALNWTALARFRLRDEKIAEEWVERDEIAMIQQIADATLTPHTGAPPP